MVQVGDTDWVAFFGIDVGINEAGRPIRTELEMNVGGFLEDGVA